MIGDPYFALMTESRIKRAQEQLRTFNMIHESDLQNLKQSFEWLVVQDNVNTNRNLVEYIRVLSDYFLDKGYYQYLDIWCSQARSRTKNLLSDFPDILLIQCNAKVALGHWQEAVDIASDLTLSNDASLTVRAHLILARAQMRIGHFGKAKEHIDLASSTVNNVTETDRGLQARVSLEKALMLIRQRHLRQALECCNQVITNKTSAEPDTITGALLHLGILHHKLGNDAEGIHLLQKILNSKSANNSAKGSAGYWLGLIHIQQGNLLQARRFAGHSLFFYTEHCRHLHGMSDAIELMGQIAFAESEIEEAESRFCEALDLCEITEYKHGIANIHRRMAALNVRRYKFGKAARYLKQAFLLYNQLGLLSLPLTTRVVREFYSWAFGKKRYIA